eukprot:6110818-Amphidinium_carterae.1
MLSCPQLGLRDNMCMECLGVHASHRGCFSSGSSGDKVRSTYAVHAAQDPICYFNKALNLTSPDSLAQLALHDLGLLPQV